MVSNNIILIIIILIVAGFIIGFYFNYTKKKNVNKDDDLNTSDNQLPANKKKKVRFNDKVSYDLSNESKKKSKIDVDSICSLYSPNNSDSSNSQSNNSDSNSYNQEMSNLSESSNRGSDQKSETPIAPNTAVLPSNLEQIDPKEIWNSNFGLPLIDQNEKEKYMSQMKKNHENYVKSMGQFTQHVMDDKTVIKTDTSIHPFDEADKQVFKGKKIKDIYDDQTSGPKAKPKKIKYKTPSSIIYENEVDINGGYIKGTNLHGYDGINDGYKLASFGNEF